MNILPVQKKHGDCIQLLIISYAENKGISYQHMFLSKINLGVDFNGFLRIEEANYLDINIEKILGIRKELMLFNNLDEFITKAKTKIKKDMPILVSIDAFDCPWNKAYQKINVCHCFLITDINEDILTIVDPYCSSEIIKVNKNILSHWRDMESTLTYRMVISALTYNQVFIDEEFYYNILIDIVDTFNVEKYNTVFNHFYEHIEADKSYWNDENRYVNLILNINHIFSHRMLLAESLNYIIQNYQKRFAPLQNIISLLHEISGNYTILKNYFIKEELTKKTKNKEIKNILQIIVQEECYMINKLYDLLKNDVQINSGWNKYV